MTTMIIALAALIAAPGSGYTDTFNRANDAYKAGDYPGAIQGFEQLVSERVTDASVFYNLANAYYRAGQVGPAIANYERALQLDPGFESAQRNLSHCVDETKQHLAKPQVSDWEQSLLYWHYRMRPDTAQTLALVFWLALWIALGLRQYKPFRYARGAAVIAGVLAVAFGASAWAKSSTGTLAVAAADTVKVRYATDEKSTVRFELHEGDRVSVDRRENGWSRVKTAGGETGWTPDANLIFVGPPYESTAVKTPEATPQPRSAS